MKITLAFSHHVPTGPLMYSVTVDHSPVCASTPDRARAARVVRDWIAQAAQRRTSFELVQWDGDKGEESPLEVSAL